MNTLYLTKAEQKQFDALPDAVKKLCNVENEASTAFETDEQIAMRYHIATFQNEPAVAALAEKVAEGTDIATLTLDEIPESILPDFYFTIGARGVSAFLESVLATAKTEEDAQALAEFSRIRHELLINNQLPA
jgi:hypothetical protein